ncbi:hypothetical protein AF332_06990 [Sporosarcina globispora]|uniref:Uncharacterized protein n=1 Tax=Sporosarcina globispora TaxID=1459 RepID=A0A0M0GAN8_SPOGL|nr:hypothetical protein [Sporosarcina globispora]KON86587.1 hypothetical protein AF332_06990 [Sporosarcina globispora]
MCKLCNGTHVIHDVSSFSIVFNTCPNCGPAPAIDNEFEEFCQRISMRKAELESARLVKEVS